MPPHVNSIRAFRTPSLLLIPSLILAAVAVAMPAGASDYNVKGRWQWVTESKWDVMNGSNLEKGGGTHMALLRGASDEHWVLHWHLGEQARLWRPTSATDVDGVAEDVPFLSFETFCSGHATLGNGKLLVVGGTIGVTTGERRCVTFDPTEYTLASKGWTQVNSSAAGHWYPTVTTLGDGKVLAVAGAQHENIVMFGGAVGSSDTVTNEAGFLNMAEDENWNRDPTTSGRPAKRQGHSAVYWNGFAVVFGGESMNNDIHRLWGPDKDPGRRRQWEAALTPSNPPSARSWHSAVVLGDTLYVFGGKDNTSGSALNELWWINLKSPSAWNQVSVQGTWPEARWDHTAVLAKDDRAQPVMIVYGGRKNATELADDDVWVLTIPRYVNQGGGGAATSFAWRGLELSSPEPGPLEGHSAVLVARGYPNPRTHRIQVFGGRKANGDLTNSLWELRQVEVADSSAIWTFFDPGLGDTIPRRMRHAAVYDKEWTRMIVHGGDTTPTAAGGNLGDLWELDLENADWSPITITPTDSVPLARSGHKMVIDSRPIQVHVPEIYDPDNGASGTWTSKPDGPKYQPYYPFMFTLPDGNVFFAGNGPEHSVPPTTESYIYNPAAQEWTNQKTSGSLGGSAVYWPDLNKVMKCGGDDDVTNSDEQETRVLTIGSGNWIEAADMPESRTFHNLTQLPDGRVLLSGGKTRSYGGAFNNVARMWDPTQSVPEWGPSLASDPANRGYHSSALLLPDARILCAGGPGGADREGTWRATIYSPPYLYKSNGVDLADRPTITSSPNYTVHYNEPFYVNVDVDPGTTPIDSIKIFCLIRPGAPTHGFDQNQRYVSLAPYTMTHGMLRTVLTDNPNKVPPGDYLLFAVRTGVAGVPSVAKWIKIQNEAGGVDNTAPASAGLTYSDVQSNSVVLKWNAPGDDGTTGTATQYSLRKRLSTAGAITDANFFENPAVGFSGLPRPAGAQEQALAETLSTCTTYFFGLKTRDERTNGWSAVSVVTVGTSGCGGGGGGELPESARPVGGGPVVAREQILRLGSSTGGTAGLTIAHSGPTAQVDSAAILLAPRSGNSMTLVSGNQLEVVARREAEQLLLNGTEVSLSNLETAPGDRLIARFTDSDAVRGIVVETGASDSDNTPERRGFRVLVPNSQGQWVLSTEVVPDFDWDELVLRTTTDSVCVELVGGHTILAIDRLVASAMEPSVVSMVGTEARHSEAGNLAGLAESVELADGQSLEIHAGLPATGQRADVFLYLKTSAASGQGLRSELDAGRKLPAAFTLSQNEPNPFGEGTLIRFAVPIKTQVMLEVFDIHGRRVRTLSQSEWPAGEHTLEWNGRDEQGQRVAPGVYLYRMEAGSFRASRKLVMSP